MKWLIALVVVLAALGGLFWYAVLDGAGPARADNTFDIAAYRALVAEDAQESLPTDVRVEFIGDSTAPSFATEAGAFDGQRTITYAAFQVLAPDGDIIVDAAVDRPTVNRMSNNRGNFDAAAYQRLLDAEERSAHILITHEHLDHVMGVARHPRPDAIAPKLALTRTQLAGLPEHAPGGVLAPSIAASTLLDLSQPAHVAPGIVAAAAPGHAPGEIVIYVRTTEREYLFVGDIAWMYSSIENVRGRPRFIQWLMSGVDPDRPAVLRQLRALHDLAAAEPGLVIIPTHDDVHLRQLLSAGALTEQFVVEPVESAPPVEESAPASP